MSDKGKIQDSDKRDKKVAKADRNTDATTLNGAAVPDDKSDPIPGLACYHGLIPREDMKEILKENGDFLLRNTELFSGDTRTYCLSVRWGEDVRHFALQKHANQLYCIDGKQYFPTILSMVEHYTSSGQTFTQYNLALCRPIPREPWEILHKQVQLEKKLGTGAFGDVYLGTVNLGNKPFKAAIKTLKCVNRTKEKIEEIMSEARIMRKLNHMNIVKCYGVSADIEPLYIIMEYVRGGGLDRFLKKNAHKIDLTRRLRIILDIASAVRYMHLMSVIHRDIAARNCLYDGEVLKLSDFGMSRQAKVVKLDSNDRSAIRWLAPEAFNKRVVTAVSDVWSTGILFCEVFMNGQQPYAGWSLQVVREQVVINRKCMSLSNQEGVPKEVIDLVNLMFTYEEEKRITSKDVLKTVHEIYKKYVGDDEYFSAHCKQSFELNKTIPLTPEESRPTGDRMSTKDFDTKMMTSARKKKSLTKSSVEAVQSDQQMMAPLPEHSKRSRKKSRARRRSSVDHKDGSPCRWEDEEACRLQTPAGENTQRKLKKDH